MCTRFEAMPDLVRNIFRGTEQKFLSYNVDALSKKDEETAFLEMGKELGCPGKAVKRAYKLAKKAELAQFKTRIQKQEALSRRTLDLGAKHSPEFVCTPFKTILGSMIESLEAGADTLLMTHGLCRLGYYGELLEQILRDLGYQFDFVNLSEYDMSRKKDLLKAVRRFEPKVNPARFLTQFMEGVRMVEYLDEIAARCTVFAESDLVHKIQMGHPREDIIAGVCNAVASNYLNNVGKDFMSDPDIDAI